MNKPERAALDAYFAEGDSWANDRQDMVNRSQRVAWLVAAVLGIVAICEAIALVTMMPLKTVEPYTLLVDRQTGFVQALKPLHAERISGDAALTQSFLVQYVIAREGYDVNSVQSDYRKVALWSSGRARSRYIAEMQPSAPNSPLVRYPRDTVIEVQVKSVTTLGTKTAMVRFDTRRRDEGGGSAPSNAWVAIIRYAYSGGQMKVADRYLNPLGFNVLSYRRSAETLSAPEPIAAPTSEGRLTAGNPR